MTPVETTVEEVPARVIWHSLATLFLSADNQRRFHGAADELGVTPGVLKALIELEPGAARAMRELVSQWRCDASFVTVLVDGLEERGFAARRVAPHDRRVKLVELTPAGVAAREAALSEISRPRPALAALSRTEQRDLARLLLKLVDAQAAADAVAGAGSGATPAAEATG